MMRRHAEQSSAAKNSSRGSRFDYSLHCRKCNARFDFLNQLVRHLRSTHGVSPLTDAIDQRNKLIKQGAKKTKTSPRAGYGRHGPSQIVRMRNDGGDEPPVGRRVLCRFCATPTPAIPGENTCYYHHNK